MFILRKKFKFEAAHKLVNHDGKCARLHGHSFVLTVELRGSELFKSGPKEGMLTDYGDISKVVKPLIEHHLDHHYLNDTLRMTSPTSENIAVWIYLYLEQGLRNLWAVEIEETCTSACRYEPHSK